LPASAMVLIDEAYHHFVSSTSAYSSFLDRPFNDSRVMIARTFSKIYGLAGMRIGYAVAAPDIARRLSEHGPQFGVGAVSAKAAAAALDDSEYVSMAAKRNANDRQEFMNQVNARMLRALDSHANFVMMKSPHPVDQVFEHLRKNNILVAPPIPEMNKYIRVSLGTPADMLQFWLVWDLMPGHKMDM
jgi:histidinol-phosphate aminotransferase